MAGWGRGFMRTGTIMHAVRWCLLAAAFHLARTDAATCEGGTTTVIHNDQAWVAAAQGDHSPRRLLAAAGPELPASGASHHTASPKPRFAPLRAPTLAHRPPTDRPTCPPGLNTSLEVSPCRNPEVDLNQI